MRFFQTLTSSFQTRQKLKEAYDLHFAATIERAEKQILLARHGRRLLNLLDDTPVVPGDIRPAFEHLHQARQILNDAEEDLREWTPRLDPVHSSAKNLGHNLMPATAPGPHGDSTTIGGHSVAGTEEYTRNPTNAGSVIGQGNEYGERDYSRNQPEPSKLVGNNASAAQHGDEYGGQVAANSPAKIHAGGGPPHETGEYVETIGEKGDLGGSQVGGGSIPSQAERLQAYQTQ